MSGTRKESFQNFLPDSEMAVDTDITRRFPDAPGGQVVDPLASDDGFLSIQVLEFKTSLLEAVEELHIHRDAEMRFEEQINKFVMEKQELEWEKETLQQQIDTLVHQHSESLAAQKKKFQARMAEIEGEKGKHQLSAELKDREIARLKEELKSLQLFKYSLQKKLSELEQKVQLQAQAKDGHLSQLGEVERRFGALTRQCGTVKQAHEKLVQNVEEALRLNKKLTTVNEKQEAEINILKQDVDKAKSEVIKSKVSSACKSGGEVSLRIMEEQQMQQLNLRLNMETERNKQLIKENAAVMAERQDVMSSLRQAQLLLQAQTEALSRVEKELSAQREESQALKREHRLFREKVREKEGQIDSLTEDHNRTVAAWKNEEKMLREKLTAEQEELQSVREAYGFIQEKYLGLSLSAERTREGERDLAQLEETGGSPERRGEEPCGAEDGPGENAPLQGRADPVQPPASAEPAPPHRDGTGADRRPRDTTDESSGSGPEEPEKTASDEGPPADHPQTSAALLPPGPGGPRGSVCSPAAGVEDGGDASAVGGAVAGRDRSPGRPQSCSGDVVGSPADEAHAAGCPPSADAPQGSCLDGEPSPAHGVDPDRDPAGGGREGGEQEETRRVVTETATHANDERDGDSRTETSAFQTESNDGGPGLPEASISVALAKPAEHQDGVSLLTRGADRADSDVTPSSPPDRAKGASTGDEGTAAETDEPRSTPPLPVSSCPADPAPPPADSLGEQNEAAESDQRQDSRVAAGEESATDGAQDHGASQAVRAVFEVGPSAELEAGATSARASRPPVTPDRAPEPEPPRASPVASEPDRAGERFESQIGFEPLEENVQPEDHSVQQLPEMADPPEKLDAESAPPECPGCEEGEGAWPSKGGAWPRGEGALPNREVARPSEEMSDSHPPGHKIFRSSMKTTASSMKTTASSAPHDFLVFTPPQPKVDQAARPVSRSLTPCIPSFLKARTNPWPPFRGFLQPLVSTPHTDEPISGGPPAVRRAGDTSNASSAGRPPRQKGGAREEWSAIARTFGETQPGPEDGQTLRARAPGTPAASDFPAPSLPPPPDHGAPGPQGDERSKISACVAESGRLRLRLKRKAEAEGSEGHTSTKER